MVKILFGGWPVIGLLLALLLFGVGFYGAANPDVAVGSVNGWYGFGAIMLFLWILSAIVEKKNS